MADVPAGVERALEAVTQGAGRTVVISGPPLSGKTELVEMLARAATDRSWRLVRLKGSYRDRTTPYAALAEFGAEASAGPAAPAPVSPGAEETPPEEPQVTRLPPAVPGIVPGMYYPGDLPTGRSRRGRGDLGQVPPPLAGGGPRRGGRVVLGSEVYRRLSEWASGSGAPVAVVIEEASLLDAESRETILYVAQRLRRRPILLVLALDVSLPAYRSWEEQLIGRGDVDWVRFPHAKPDPREAAQLEESFATLPPATQRLLTFLALLGGAATEVGLGRAAKMGVRELAEALAPAAAVNLMKVEEGRVVIPYASWVALLPTFVTPELRSEVHRQIAEAIGALNPEPDSKRGRELAEHLFAAQPDATALRPLLDAAEFSERLGAYDAADELLRDAERCLDALGETERTEAEVEIRLWRARVLLLSGRPAAAEAEIREGTQRGVAGGLSPDRFRERLEELLPSLRVVGPRASLVAAIESVIARLSEPNARGAQAMLAAVLAEDLLEGGRFDDARLAGVRAHDYARRADPATSRYTTILQEAITAASGEPSLEAVGGEFRDMLSPAASRVGHPPLEQMVAQLWLRYVERPRHPIEAIAAHQKAIPLLRRTRATATELFEQIGISEISLDRRALPKAPESYQRAREIADALHLLPPAPALARLWLLEGRLAVDEGRGDAARDAFRALVDLPAAAGLPGYQAEAAVRHALVDLAEGRSDSASEMLGRAEGFAALTQRPAKWRYSEIELAASVREARGGAGPLPARLAV